MRRCLATNLPITRTFEPGLTALSFFLTIVPYLDTGSAVAGRRPAHVRWSKLGGVTAWVSALLPCTTPASRRTKVPGYLADLGSSHPLSVSIILGAIFGALALSVAAPSKTKYATATGTLFLVLAICAHAFHRHGGGDDHPARRSWDRGGRRLPDTMMVAGVVIVVLLIMATAENRLHDRPPQAREASEKYRGLAHQDALTGLPNRAI